jgi:tetratricopeptide (TPR) repeat protein
MTVDTQSHPQSMETPNPTLLAILLERAGSLCQTGDLPEALHAANAAVSETQRTLSTSLESIDAFADALEARAGIHRLLGDWEAARDDYREALDQLENRPDRLAQVGRLHAGLGSVYESVGRQDKAGEQWIMAIDAFGKNDPPLEIDIAHMSNNLGMLHKAAGNLETAEAYYLKALGIYHAYYGQHSEETATVASNLGAVYQAKGLLEQSREMHMIALETRTHLLGEEHPDAAQSHNNLALVMIESGDPVAARNHFEKALATFENLGTPYADDLDAVAGNYCAFLRQEGEPGLADLIEARTSVAR